MAYFHAESRSPIKLPRFVRRRRQQIELFMRSYTLFPMAVVSYFMSSTFYFHIICSSLSLLQAHITHPLFIRHEEYWCIVCCVYIYTYTNQYYMDLSKLHFFFLHMCVCLLLYFIIIIGLSVAVDWIPLGKTSTSFMGKIYQCSRHAGVLFGIPSIGLPLYPWAKKKSLVLYACL